MTPGKKKLIKILSIVLGSVAVFVGIIVLVIVAVSRSNIQSISIGGVSKELYLGNLKYSSVDLQLSIYPTTASSENVTVYSENENIAKVELIDGKLHVTAVAVGTTNVVAVSSKDNKKIDKCEIIVNDVAIEDLNFVDASTDNETHTCNIKRDGTVYSVKFNVTPLDSNLSNVEVNYDKDVLSSVVFNQEDHTVDIIAKESSEATSSLITLYYKQSTTEGLKIVGQSYLQVYINAKQIETKLLLGNLPGKDYVTNQSNLAYLDKDVESSNYIYAMVDLTHVLSDNNRVKETFDCNNYNIYLNGVAYSDSNNKILITVVSNNFLIETSSSENGLLYGETVLVSFEHKSSGAVENLQLVGAKKGSSSVVTSESLGVGTHIVSDINEYTYATGNGGTENIRLYNIAVQSITINSVTYGSESSPLQNIVTDLSSWSYENDVLQISAINGVIHLRGKAAAIVTIEYKFSSSYWDDRFLYTQGQNFNANETITIS